MHLSSGFSPGWPQRAPISVNTRMGPGAYNGQGQHGTMGFAQYEGPPATTHTRQPFRQLRTSAQLRTPSLRYTSSLPRMAPVVPYDHFPGPAHYELGKYSQFTGGYPGRHNGAASMSPLPKMQTFTAAKMARTSIRDVYADKRCGIICRPNSNPGPAAYAPVPLMDRLRMSMPHPPTPSRGKPCRGRNLDTFVHSPTSLSATLAELQGRSSYPPS